jgi:hypothetical protein
MIRGMTSGAGSRWAGRSRRGSSCAVPVGGRGCVEVWVRRGRRWGRELSQLRRVISGDSLTRRNCVESINRVQAVDEVRRE